VSPRPVEGKTRNGEHEQGDAKARDGAADEAKAGR
jgi:hypothetical protein